VAATPQPVRRRDTRLEAEGAEFLVLGSLLAEGISAWKAYTNFPGYDILAGDIGRQRICRIQVKMRYETGARGFPIGNFDCDFVCFVRLNRGTRPRRTRATDVRRIRPDPLSERPVPEIYVLPRRVVKAAWLPGAPFGSGGVLLANISNPDRYLHAWDQIKTFLAPTNSRRGRLS
jgi:hypothetical protein